MTSQEDLIREIEADVRDTAGWTGRSELDPRVLAAIGRVRRAGFVPPGTDGDPNANEPLPIGCGQTISQPFIVALMTDLLALEPGQKVLEIGTGSGYQAAVLTELGMRVYSVEVIPELLDRARQTLAREGYAGVELRTADGSRGWPEHAPYDGIIVTAAAREVPPALVDQLRRGGRMAAPVGPPYADQVLVLVEKDSLGVVSTRTVLRVAFVPLTGGG
jgi:protein-L-isoaspartate(D-aspartate) O-methyltransferase